MPIPTVDQCVLAAMAAVLLWAAASDALTMTIPNRLPVAVAALYPAWVIAAWPAVDPVGGLAAGAIVLAAGFAAFACGWTGGGDVKLLSALALWAGLPQLIELLFVIALIGGAMALATLGLLTVRRYAPTLRGTDVGNRASLVRQPIPYGVAIALGGAVLALRLAGA